MTYPSRGQFGCCCPRAAQVSRQLRYPCRLTSLRTVAELQTRLTLSFIVTPHTSINLATTDDTRAYVRDYLLPMITAFKD
jgi:hypothetical protein